MKKYLILFVLLFSTLGFATMAPKTPKCGSERWPVKTLQDPSLDTVNFDNVKEITIREMAEWAVPDSRPATTRVADVETTVWRTHAMFLGYMHEKDGDFHLVLADPNKKDDQWVTIIGEVPLPSCANPKYTQTFYDLRVFLLSLGRPHGNKMLLFVHPIPVVVEGVGFFDFLHGQTGVAPNGVELHPILKLNKDDNTILRDQPLPDSTLNSDSLDV